MPLPTFTSVEEVPEAFREFARDVDGKVTLDLVPGADVVGLKKKNAELLEQASSLRQKYAGIDPEEFQSLKATAGKSKDVDARLAIAAENEKKATDLVGKMTARLRDQAKRTEVTAALASAGASVALLGPVVAGMVDVEEDGDTLHVVVRNADGSIRYKDGAGTRFTVAHLLDELKTRDEFKPAFSVSVGSGGDARPGAGAPGGSRVIQPSDKKAVMQAIQSGDLRAGKVRIAS